MYYPVNLKAEKFSNDCGCGCGGDCQGDELAGIGSVFKKIASVGAGFIPGVGGAVSGMIDSIGSNPDMDKKCAKKPNDKKCIPYLAEKKRIADEQAAKEAREQQQIQLLQQIAEKNNSQTSSTGIDTTTLAMVGGGALLLILLMGRK